MGKYASRVVEQAKAWLGYNEADGSHKEIIDVYNSHKPLARGYAVNWKTDAWCATFVSAVAIKVGYTDIIPTECGCQQMITLMQKMGIFVEDESVTPKAGWIIFYDWQDNNSGDNTGYADHVGIVEKVENGKITIIEGNYSNSVKRRTLPVNAKYIRGYGAPKYGDGTVTTTPVEPAAKPTNPTNQIKTDSAKSFSKAIAGAYKVTASWLNVRSGAGTEKSIIIAIPKDTIVNNYGYYTTYDGVNWLYVQFKYKGITYNGFVSSKYLTK